MSTYDRFSLFKAGDRINQSEPFKWLCDIKDELCESIAQAFATREIPSPPEAHSPTDGPEEAPKENG